MALHLPAPRRASYKKKPKALAWPHPLTRSTIHPDLLTLHGFHHTPTIAQPALTTCFLCEVVVEWSEGDDPSSVHLDKAPECGWAVLRSESWEKDKGATGEARGKDWDWESTSALPWPRQEESFPGNERLARAREMTFSAGWPAGKGVPTSEEIAKAGWYFRPGNEEDEGDRCVCAYCERAVEGWEKGDDPLALHQRKLGLHCPFFLASAPGSTSLPSPAPEDVPEALQRSTRRTSPAPRSIRTRTAPASETDDAPAPLSRSTRGRNAPTSDAEAPAAPAPKGRKGKQGKKVDEEETADEEPASAPKSKPKSRGAKKVVEVKVEAPVEAELPEEVEEEREKPKSKPKFKARSKPIVEIVVRETMVEAVEQEAEVEDAEMEGVVRELEAAVVEEEMEFVAEPEEVAVIKKKGKATVTKGKKGKKAVVVHEDTEAPIDAAPKASKPAKKGATKAPKPTPAPPLTPTDSLSPRPVRPLPSPARTQLPTAFVPRPNPFLDAIPPPTASERELTVGEWYDVCGRKMYEALERETREEEERFEERVKGGREVLEKILVDAERREGRRGGRTPRA